MSLDNCFLIRFLQTGNYSFLGKALPMLVRPLYDAAKQVTGFFNAWVESLYQLDQAFLASLRGRIYDLIALTMKCKM